MKTLAARILAEHPRIGVTDFFDRVGRQADQVGVPLLRRCIVMRYSFTHLYESLLDVAWVAVVLKIFGDLLVGEMTSEPGVPPEQEWHQGDQPGRQEEEQALARGHAAVGGCFGGRVGFNGSGWGHDSVVGRWSLVVGEQLHFVGNYTSIYYVGVEHAVLL